MRAARHSGLLPGLALTATALLALAGCGGGDGPSARPQAPVSTISASFSTAPLPATKPSPGPRPTLEQLTVAVRASKNAVTGKEYTPAAAKCIAQALLDTDLTDGALNAIAANVGNYVPPASETATFKALIPKIINCAR